LDKIIYLEKIDEIDETVYAGFGVRLGANILDLLFSLPLLFFIGFIFISVNTIGILLLSVIFIHLVRFFYMVYLPKRYGGTPGKLIVGIKIIKIDSTNIGWKEAILRESVVLIIWLLGDIVFFIHILGFIQNIAEINNILAIIGQIWGWSEVIVLLTNKRKRAVHDFIAGTVVVKSKYINKIREKFEG